MINKEDVLYNRHILSKNQIETHFGKVNESHISHSNETFQNAGSFFTIADALQAKGIKFIPLKGPLLSYQLYQNYVSRRFYDLDFLIDYKDIYQFSKILKKLGYWPVKEFPSTLKEKEVLKRKDNQLLFKHERECTDVEIHWRFFRKYKFLDIGFRKLYEKKTIPYSLEGRTFYKLPNETELLYILIHGSKHAWFRLKWLIDVNDYIKNVDLDFNKVHRLAVQHGFLRMIGLYNAIAGDFIPNACLFPFGSNKFPKHLKRYSYKKIMEPTPGFAKSLSFREKVLNMTQRILFEHSLNPNIYSIQQIIKELIDKTFTEMKRRLKYFPLKKG